MRTADQVQDEISALLRHLADPAVAGESVKACIRRAATRAGLTYRQTKKLWYRETKNIPAFLADELRERATRHDKELRRAAFHALVEMQQSDPEFFSDALKALGDIVLPICCPNDPARKKA
jgi:uncharacterized protein YbaR (Trm112 family)